jgi:hypothetical protein
VILLPAPKKEKGGRMNKLFKSKRFIDVLVFFSTIALSCVMAQAQMVTGVKANIPFAFTVSNTRLPAGDYEISQVSDIGPALELRDASDKISVLFLTESTEGLTKLENPELVFDKIGDKSFLKEIRAEDYSYQLTKSREETELENQGLKSESHRVTCTHAQARNTKSSQTKAY